MSLSFARPVWEIEERARDRGMARAAAAHHQDLVLARQIARELGADGREVCADMVRAVLAERWPKDFGPDAEVTGRKRNWMGACFTGGEWEPAGWVKSRTPGSHSNRLVSWRLRSAA